MSPSQPAQNSPSSSDAPEISISSPSHAEIAKVAGVSRSMVSAFLSGSQYRSGGKGGIGVGSSSASSIRRACKQLNYFPGDPAMMFRVYPETAPIGLMLTRGTPSGFSSPVHSLIFEGIANRACEEGVDLHNLFYQADFDYLIEPRKLPQSILRGGVKKVIIVGGYFNYTLAYQLLKMGVAVTVVGKAPPIDGISAIVPDFFSAARTAIHSLCEHGHRNIAVVMDHFARPDSYHGRLIRDGCSQAMRDHQIPFDTENIIIHAPLNNSGFESPAEQILNQSPRPTAVYCIHGETARGLATDLSMAGLGIPEDISLMVGDDDMINQNMGRGFSAIHLPYKEMGENAFDEVTHTALEGPPEKQKTVVLPFKLIDRGTVSRIQHS